MLQFISVHPPCGYAAHLKMDNGMKREIAQHFICCSETFSAPFLCPLCNVWTEVKYLRVFATIAVFKCSI